jgi:hypothetical protein
MPWLFLQVFLVLVTFLSLQNKMFSCSWRSFKSPHINLLGYCKHPTV